MSNLRYWWLTLNFKIDNMVAEITDSTIMPFGKYKGKSMANVPAVYLLWLYNNACTHEGVKKYIISNLDILNKEVSRIPRR